MATIKEVAHYAKVSVATVSRAINGNGYVKQETRDKIEAAIQALNYQPNEVARSLNMKKSKLIGLLLPDMSNPFFTLVARGVEDMAMARGYHIMIGNGAMDETKELNYLSMFKVNQCSGVIASQLSTPHAFEQLHALQSPCVLIDRAAEGDTCVEADHVQGGTLQAETILQGNATSVLLLYQNLDYTSFRARFDAAKKVLEEANVSVVTQLEGALTEKLLERYIDTYTIDSIICSNDVMAFKVMQWLHTLNIKVPEEVQVVGYDDIPFATMFIPTLTTVRQPAYELGQQATQQLIDELEGRVAPTSTILEVDMVHRASTRRS
ncbi:LacI family DNA-binding transcriptional regulator [Staphylococcus chromogenes]|uniref:LacI family DNA-binding transcriptional regulator n=1 Tax=Staphylococcus chromogenes TaxID=46126 RepID=UPI000D02707A|nr:LacI family DNA-binding transcriptional regulator [Staphylococcus chromogenes]MDT0655873.1 LacI family DNA-binding transcriptional regulator [Staphylococcus chromogenes]MDT0680589.1 LacI family DNA-binding transcriptional regulator [Staphylococcus chromogenes]MDY3277997.1 LacI family DNA-binding transcriptional regulator [Staphylococcus chromogenes]PTF58707.1 LacI family transcriptional regulator [Staphylococcus chromogenes]PTF78177.1 LacI family transcriptional regulator [Staphylococcus ch